MLSTQLHKAIFTPSGGGFMSIEDSQIVIETLGKYTYPQKYIYIQPMINEKGELEYEIKIQAGIGDLLNSTFLLWEAIKSEAAEMSDQDLYEMCEDFDIDFNTFKAQIRRPN